MVGYARRIENRRITHSDSLRGRTPSCRIVAIVYVPYVTRLVQPLRLLLMIVLLAFLPLQAWAGWLAPVSGAAGIDLVHAQPAVVQAQGNVAVAADQADFATDFANSFGAPASSGCPCPADNAEPSPPGPDFAEQLLPAPMPRVMTSAARSPVPRYAGAALPDPDLPLQPRPPRG